MKRWHCLSSVLTVIFENPQTLIQLNHCILILFWQFIGTLDIPRPSSRVEIVAAMRRIRVSYVWNLYHKSEWVIVAIFFDDFSLGLCRKLYTPVCIFLSPGDVYNYDARYSYNIFLKKIDHGLIPVIKRAIAPSNSEWVIVV